MKTLGQEIFEKYNLRKDAFMNTGDGQHGLERKENNFSSEMEKGIHTYNINLEAANENIVAKGKIVISNSWAKKIIKKAAGKLFYLFFRSLLNAINYFQEKVIFIFIANRDILICQNEIIKKMNETIEKDYAEFTDKLEKIESVYTELTYGIKAIEESHTILASEIKTIEESYTRLENEIAKIKENAVMTDTMRESYFLHESSKAQIGQEDRCESILEKFRMGQEEDDQKLISAFYERMEELINAKDNIVIFCAGLHEYSNIEAIRNEAYHTFVLLRKNSVFHVTLLSLEQRDMVIREDVIFATRERISSIIDRINPAAILIFESLPLVALDFDGLFYRYKTVIKITSQDPLLGLEAGQIDELRHANDFGVFHFIVESDYAKQVMFRNGFFNVRTMYPIVDFHRICVDKKMHTKANIIVGYASAPVLDVQMEDKGVFLLEKVVRKLPQVQFQILWRNEQLQVPQGFIEAHNCKVVLGQVDMQEFYRTIDVLLIPYTSANNHACPLSGVEAVLSHIPLISTKPCGAAEFIQKYCAGIVCSAEVSEICRSITDMAARYSEFYNKMHVEQAQKDFVKNELESYLYGILFSYFPNEFITIEHWNSIMVRNGKYLVKGHHNIKKYYQDQEIAESYNTNRFIQYPGNCYDIMERSSINVIMGQTFKNRSDDFVILDIACGDGRIVQEDLRWGTCVAIDSSASMLNVVRKRFPNKNNLELRQCDFFEDNIKQKFDVITAFRYIRHYDGRQRRKIYSKIKNCLKEDGILIFDACNIRYSMEDRKKAGWEEFHIYDVFWTEDSIREELRECGFHIVSLLPIEIKNLQQGPVTWTVAARPEKGVLKCR